MIGPQTECCMTKCWDEANIIPGKDKLSFICENALMVFSCQLQIIKALISSRYEKVVWKYFETNPIYRTAKSAIVCNSLRTVAINKVVTCRKTSSKNNYIVYKSIKQIMWSLFIQSFCFKSRQRFKMSFSFLHGTSCGKTMLISI